MEKHEAHLRKFLKVRLVMLSRNERCTENLSQDSTPGKVTLGRYYPIFNSIELRHDAGLHTLAHEMFHAWQYKHSERWFYRFSISTKSKKPDKVSFRKYKASRIEIEANLFAAIYCIMVGERKLGWKELRKCVTDFMLYNLFLCYLVPYLKLVVAFFGVIKDSVRIARISNNAEKIFSLGVESKDEIISRVRKLPFGAYSTFTDVHKAKTYTVNRMGIYIVNFIRGYLEDNPNFKLVLVDSKNIENRLGIKTNETEIYLEESGVLLEKFIDELSEENVLLLYRETMRLHMLSKYLTARHRTYELKY